MKRSILVSVLIALLFVVNTPAGRPFERLSSWKNLPPAERLLQEDDVTPLPRVNYIRSRDFDTRHIALDLKFDWETNRAFGIEHFTFSPLKDDFDTLNLDAGLMVFTSVKLSDGTELEHTYDEDKTLLSIKFDDAYSVGDEVTVVIEYQTKGEPVKNALGFGGGGGLKFVKPTADEPNKPWQIWSQGESEYNRYWFPSFDYPNDFRTTELKATVKKPLIVVSNGALVETKENGDGTRTYHWKMDTPYTNYLTSIAVGEYVEVRGEYDGIPVSTYVYKNWQREGEVTAKRLPDMVKFFSEKLDFKYPYTKYAQTIANEFNGGMENITATTQTDNMIIDARTELDGDQDGLQAHELAHQWFGNYVTCRDWSEIWLNESFATYMESLWQGNSKGKDFFLYNEVKQNQDGYFGSWNQGIRRPIVTKYYANPDAVFDAYAYPRGGAVLHMLRKQLGDKEFFRALNHYLKSNANEPVQTEDFRIAIEEATGRSMDAFFDQWLYRMGHPVFDVKQEFDSVNGILTLRVKQIQTRDITSAFPQVEYFQTPVEIEIGTSRSKRVETVFIKPQEENTFTFEMDAKPLLVDFDNEGTLIKEIKFEKSLEDLMYQAQKDEDILGRNWAQEELTKRAQKKDATEKEKSPIVSFFREASAKEPTWQLRRNAIRNLRAVLYSGRITTPGDEPAPFIPDEQISAALLLAANDKDSRVRSEAIGFLSGTKDKKYFDVYRRALMSDQSYSVIDAAAVAIAGTGHADAYAILRKLAQTDSWRERVSIAGLNGLAELGDPKALDLGLKYAQDKGSSNAVKNAALNIVGSVGKGDPRAFDLIFASFKKALDNNSFQSMFNGLQSLIKLADPRGQEAFDLMKAKFKDSPQFMGFINQQESLFKAALNK